LPIVIRDCIKVAMLLILRIHWGYCIVPS